MLDSPTASFVPRPRLHETDRIAVASDPAATWSAVRRFDLYQLPWVRALFALRGAGGKTATFDDITAPGNGFRRLAEDEGRFIVIGAIGKFWRPRIPFVQVDPTAFAAFDEPDFGRVAWSIEVIPRGDGGSWIVVDLRVDATSDEAWSSFVPYWIAIGRFSRSIRRHTLRHFERTLGRARPDSERRLPGDDLLPPSCGTVTEAITIEAPVADVWPSVERLAANDDLAVLDREPGRALVLGSPSLLARVEIEPSAYLVTWAFFLEPIDAGATYLVVRVRADFTSPTLSRVARPFLLALHSWMESAQLRQLEARVTRALLDRHAGAPQG